MHQGVVRSNFIYLTLLESDEFKEILRKKKRESFDIGREFQNSTGISLEEYIDITVGLISVLLYCDPEDTGVVTHFTVDGFLRESSLRKETLKQYLSIEAKGLKEFAEIFKTQSPLYANRFSYLPFRQYPLLQIPNGPYVCIDPCFLTEKLNSGIYWKIIDNLGTNKSVFFEVFGHLFELYVRKVLESVCSNQTSTVRIINSRGLLFLLRLFTPTAMTVSMKSFITLRQNISFLSRRNLVLSTPLRNTGEVFEVFEKRY